MLKSIFQAEDEGDDTDDAEGDAADSDKEDHKDDPVAEVDSDVKVRICFLLLKALNNQFAISSSSSNVICILCYFCRMNYRR